MANRGHWEIRVDGAPSHIARIVRSISDQSKNFLRNAVYQMAQITSREVRRTYRSHARDALRGGSELGETLRKAGKDRGAEAPPRTPSPPGSSSFYELARNVILAPISAAAASGWSVKVDPTALSTHTTTNYPMGVPLGLLAYWLENRIGGSVQWPLTLRMVGYLSAVRRGKGGFGTRTTDHHMPNISTGKVVVFTPPDRPVWRYVAARLRNLLPIMDENLRKVVEEAVKGFPTTW